MTSLKTNNRHEMSLLFLLTWRRWCKNRMARNIKNTFCHLTSLLVRRTIRFHKGSIFIVRMEHSYVQKNESKVFGARKFYDIEAEYEKEKTKHKKEKPAAQDIIDYIAENIIGNDYVFAGPYGKRKIVYCDYTASGRSLRFIEDFIQKEILPTYGNTHTTTTVTSLQTTLFRHEARDIIRNSVNASEHDAVVFTGSGCTAALHKFIHALRLEKPPIVFVSPYEHHSTLLPWREVSSEVIMIRETVDGTVDLDDLEQNLRKFASSGDHLVIGCLSAASNVTGTLVDVDAVTILLHKYNALAVWDYATAAPHLTVDMNPVITGDDQGLVYKDAIVLSPHKFIGGVGTPGVLIAKKKLFQNFVPSNGGGGSVFFVSKESHRYLKEIEMREEGGTPAIVESIRAGLVFQLKEAVSTETIWERESRFSSLVLSSWRSIHQLMVLGSWSARRLPVFSFVIRHDPSGLYLHHNFVSALLNDLFGIQSRGGCACAGPYAQHLLGIDEPLAKKYEALLLEDSRLDRTHLRRYNEYSSNEILRPGFVRLNFSFFMDDDDVSFIIDSVKMVAEDGWKLLPQYIFNPETGEWRHNSHQVFKERKWLGSISYSSGIMTYPQMNDNSSTLPQNKQEVLAEARLVFDKATKTAGRIALADQRTMFSDSSEALRWFLLPSEAHSMLYSRDEIVTVSPPFTPKVYQEPTTEDVSAEKKLQNENLEVKDDFAKDPSLKENGVAEIRVVAHPGRWYGPPKSVMKPTLQAIEKFDMIRPGDRILVCLSGGKDSLSLLHALRQHQFCARSKGMDFQLGAVTVDPKSSAYDPSPLKPYLQSLDTPYFYEEQGILNQASRIPDLESICSFCSRMKRGRLYACARREGYNVLAFGQHLDDLAETFVMSLFHNGRLRTMKAHYTVKEGDLRVIRPFVYVREKNTRQFAEKSKLPVIAENCPACFEAPKERHRVKQLLAQQEILFPRLFWSLRSALQPLMEIDRCGVEGETLIRHALQQLDIDNNYKQV